MTNELIIIIKLFLSGLIGFLVGKERKKNDKPGGSRTFALVGLASCLVSILTLELIGFAKANGLLLDIARLASYTIASIGFLGSGIIVQNKNNIEGLTTASSLFLIVPIGLSIGFGYYFIGIFASILMYIILELKHWTGDKEND